MKRNHAFFPNLVTLESRWLPSSMIYSNDVLNAEQDAYVAQAQHATNPVVFFGDSITYNWGSSARLASGSSVFTKDFSSLDAANFGISGDTTSDLVARVQGGDFAGKPKVAVVMIGFNDLYHGETPEEAASGVVSVVQAIHSASPQTMVLLLGVLPSDVTAMNPEIQQLDALITNLGKDPGVIYMNPGVLFLGAHDASKASLLIDGVHPDEAGYNLIAGAIDSTVVKLFQQGEYSANRPIPTSLLKKVEAPSVVENTSIATGATTSSTDGPDADLIIPPVSSSVSSTEVVSGPTTKQKSYATELINVSSS